MSSQKAKAFSTRSFLLPRGAELGQHGGMHRLLLCLALAGCGGAQKAMIPVDSPLKPWREPEIPAASHAQDEDEASEPKVEPAAADSTGDELPKGEADH